MQKESVLFGVYGKMKNEYFVIPDIHGMNDVLQTALAAIYKGRPEGKIVFLGDYIDRGPDNRKVIETVMNPPDGWEFICLRGNHEQMFLDAYDGLTSFYDKKVVKEWKDDEKALSEVVSWMRRLKFFHIEDKSIFAHAFYEGHLQPGQQDLHKCVWARYRDGETFYSSDDSYLCHGHTPRINGPSLSLNRTNLDGGVYLKNGNLLVARFYKGVRGPTQFYSYDNGIRG